MFVPVHFATDESGLAGHDGAALYISKKPATLSRSGGTL